MNDTIIPPSEEPKPSTTFKMHGAPADVCKLLLALGKARAKMDPVAADAQGQFQNRTFKYADLASIYKAAIPALSAEGITVIHPNCQVDTDTQRACTMVAGYGAMIEVAHDYRAIISPDNVKAHGSMMTYLNRYQLRGLCAVAGDDDLDNDGKAATAPFKSQPKPAAPPPGNGRTRSRDPEPEAPPPKPAPSNGSDKLEDEGVDDAAPLVKGGGTSLKLTELLEVSGIGSDRVKRDAFILEVCGKDVSSGRVILTYGDGRKLIRALQQLIEAAAVSQ